MVFRCLLVSRSYGVRGLASTLLGVLVLILGYVMDIKFLYKKIAVVQNQSFLVKGQIQAAQTKLELMQTPSKENKLEKVASPVPELEIINVLNLIEKEIIAAQITALLFEPTSVQQDENFIIYPLKFTLRGKYQNLLTFINKIMHLSLSYLTVIEELDFQKEGNVDTDDLQLQILLLVYTSKQVLIKSEAAKREAIPLLERNIFKPEISRKDVDMWSNQELRFMGLVKEVGTVFGVIVDPLNRIYRVKIGDKVGLNKSTITAIDECGVTTTKKEEGIYRDGKCP